MIYEVVYKNFITDNFEDHVKNVFKIDFKNDCFVYFHFGEKAEKFFDQTYPNQTSAYFYIKELESKFKVHINWVNLDFIFNKLSDHQCITFQKEDVERFIYYYKMMYFNAFENYIKDINK